MDINLASNFKLFAAARPLLTPAYFLCFFGRKSLEIEDPRYCIAQNSGGALGPIVLALEETDSGVYTDAQVELEVGDWYLTVYEQSSSTNYDPAASGRVVWSEIVRVNNPNEVPERDSYVCQGGGSCTLNVVVNVNGTEAANVTGLDPCVENTINLTMV